MTLLRKCISCGKRYNKFSMIRINRSPRKNLNTEIKVIGIGDKTYFPGRCSYICCNLECFKKAKKSRRIEKSFKCKINEDVYDKIENIILLSSLED